MIYALVDCNSFFCSCERVFRPDLQDRPIAVLSNNDGCFVSCTRDVKAFGIRAGDPYFKFKDICAKNSVAVFSSNFSLYTDMSDRVMSVLSRYTPEMEVYSVDEAFLNLSGFTDRDLYSYCQEIKEAVFKLTGIPVSIGVGRTKTLAKVANNVAKKNACEKGVSILLDEKKIDLCLKETPLIDVWGLGKQSCLKLKTLRIKNAKEFKDFRNDKTVRRVLGKTGMITRDELRGIRSYGERGHIVRKSIQCSRTFGGVVTDLRSVRESIAKHIATACERARAQGCSSGAVNVFFGTTPFRDCEQHYADKTITFETSSDTRKIIRYSLNVVDELFRAGMEYKKSGITIGKLTSTNSMQLNMFESCDSIKTENLMKVMDLINLKDGEGTIRFAACGTLDREIRVFNEFRTPKYQSSWSELPKVR